MSYTICIITPPFTQLNTPYPASAYLKGFLNTKHIDCYQADLGIEVILQLFSKTGLLKLFTHVNTSIKPLSENAQRILALKNSYINTIDAVISFLQGYNPTLALQICKESFLPQASRFAQIENLAWAFGTMATHDKAKHLATLYLEDISDLIVECVDAHFGFSRYAERLARSANSFDKIYQSLNQKYTYIDTLLIEILQQRIASINPTIVALSVPFPGNLYAAFRIAQWLKKHYPNIKIAMGGGFANTELRSVSDARVFEFFDFITLDDGEAPIENLLAFVQNKRPITSLKRTFMLLNGVVTYFNNTQCKEYKQFELGTPDYSNLYLDKYISVIEIANPMHRLWSDGRWNKLTMAHGCYWGKCTFCDISLDYIKNYEPLTANLLCNRIEELIAKTGQNGFHFVDEAAPPALMRDVALEIIRRNLTVTWWTNIRFEKSFTADLCLLLKASGCVAISGGLEVASDRLLQLIQKGVTVAQVAQVTRNFTQAGIMVHAYLMYGFPTQSAQETIDSLEMVRQMFAAGILQSAFWHQFAMTAHSPVGLSPDEYKVQKQSSMVGTFANNDLEFEDKTGATHELFSYGLKKSLYNYMHKQCLDFPLQNWFDFKTPKTSIHPNFIIQALNAEDFTPVKPTAKIVWIGNQPQITFFTKSKKGKQWEMANLTFNSNVHTKVITCNKTEGQWLINTLALLSPHCPSITTWQHLKNSFETYTNNDFEPFWYNKQVKSLKMFGLLTL
ncbi:MAG: radical SAM protein [Sphingobacteriales bacterium]|nr:MAG: radical SAM protein [Sphingobacteriales bacterium]TAF82563.1 MAG: radical SAM protein [Sphingobacteriales bacterium]